MTEQTRDRLLEQAKDGDQTAQALFSEYGSVEWKLESAKESLQTQAERIIRRAEFTMDALRPEGVHTFEEMQSSASDYDASIAKVRELSERLQGLDRIIALKLDS